jgi:hypothetical protein
MYFQKGTVLYNHRLSSFPRSMPQRTGHFRNRELRTAECPTIAKDSVCVFFIINADMITDTKKD